MKNLFWLIFAICPLFILSCGGEENGSEESVSGDETIAVSIRAAGSDECTGMELGCLTDLALVVFQIKNGLGETVFSKSVERKDIKNHLELTGIKNAENATLIISVFGADSSGVANLNSVKWQGKATGLKFEKGKTTKVKILLYPTTVQTVWKNEKDKDGNYKQVEYNTELSMPEGLTIPRFGHVSTVLTDGRILVTGGFTSCFSNGKCPASKSVEIIDLESGTVETLADMVEERAMHTVVPLSDGSVLILGGVHSLDINWQDSAFEGFPLMRFVPTTASTTIEKYMPSYPKHNMKENGLGMPLANLTKSVTTASPIPFSTFQSIVAEKISDTETAVFLVGGLEEISEEGSESNKIVASKKTYKFIVSETEDGSVSVGEIEELAESSDGMLLPAVAYSNGSVIAAGGRPSASEFAGSVISKDASENFGTSKDNIFFTQGTLVNGNLYTFGGYELDSEGNFSESNYNKIRKWNVASKDISSLDNVYLLTRGNNIIFPGIVLDVKNNNNRLHIIGGTNATDIYQVVNADSLALYGAPQTHMMSDKRVMPSPVVVPAGVIGDTPMIVIIGGISMLDSNGSAVKTIKINNL